MGGNNLEDPKTPDQIRHYKKTPHGPRNSLPAKRGGGKVKKMKIKKTYEIKGQGENVWLTPPIHFSQQKFSPPEHALMMIWFI